MPSTMGRCGMRLELLPKMKQEAKESEFRKSRDKKGANGKIFKKKSEETLAISKKCRTFARRLLSTGVKKAPKVRVNSVFLWPNTWFVNRAESI
ncbi:MAG: hypothetical protein K5945_10920 [Bacteroidaceae bacterium]|nr:hypothetical protein [Bacteroidaceae bacterium]